jgi:5-methylcytosine-specific restriction endonuclease McrA
MAICKCEWCGLEFSRKLGKRNAGRFCTKKCSGAKRTAVSREYRAQIVAAKNAVKIARKLVRRERSVSAREERRVSASLRTVGRICKVCGSAFSRPLHKPGLWTLCHSLECRAQAKRSAMRRNRQLHGRKPAERARHRGLPVEKRCGPIAICTRDCWRCQLCGISTPRRLRGTHDSSAPEVDHIIPLSHPDSPGHVWSNVQCACRQCNLKKGANVLGQLRLAV